MRVLQRPDEGAGWTGLATAPLLFRATWNDSTEHPTPMKEDLPWNRCC